MWAAKWELAMPVVVHRVDVQRDCDGRRGGGADRLLRALHPDGRPPRSARSAAICCACSSSASVVIGGVLVILGVAVGLTNYLVGVQLPAKLVEWVRAHIESRLAFLLVLNVFLLIVGWLMEIFAAIVVVVPLIVPLGAAFGIHPGPPRHHLHRQPRARVPDAAGRPQHLPGVVPLQAAGARSLPRHAAVHGDPRRRRAGHHVRAVADDGAAGAGSGGCRGETGRATNR